MLIYVDLWPYSGRFAALDMWHFVYCAFWTLKTTTSSASWRRENIAWQVQMSDNKIL